MEWNRKYFTGHMYWILGSLPANLDVHPHSPHTHNQLKPTGEVSSSAISWMSGNSVKGSVAQQQSTKHTLVHMGQFTKQQSNF